MGERKKEREKERMIRWEVKGGMSFLMRKGGRKKEGEEREKKKTRL